ncbi:MAG: pyridoxine 5'-phosphate synthase [Vicinamibacterales bacterium]
MVRLSVNVNKVATLRNSRGAHDPKVLDAVDVCLAAGVTGITVHPRADQRHITPTDVREVAARLRGRRPGVEFNIEGDPRPDFIDLVHDVRPDQCTLVPVVPGEITSQAGWTRVAGAEQLPGVIAAMKQRGIRVSLFVDPTADAIALARQVGADRVELYTEPFARAYEQGAEAAVNAFERYVVAAELAHEAGLGINAGHDLNLDNLVLFRELPYLDEVSIGHAIISRALFVGLDTVVREYLRVLAT